MSIATDFPVTELYGCQPGYPLNQNLCPPGQGFHKGIDYGCPVGTPIVVNGTLIGISGDTGAVTGAHLHVGRWLNNQSTDPGVGNGFTFAKAVVTEIGEDPVNGKYVRVEGDGASWVYLHMSNNNLVVVGQELKGGIVGNIKLIGTPASVSWADGRIDVFAQGSDNGLWHKWYEKGWSGWKREGDAASPPSVASWGAQRLDIFFTGIAGDLVHIYYNGKFSAPESLGTPS